MTQKELQNIQKDVYKKKLDLWEEVEVKSEVKNLSSKIKNKDKYKNVQLKIFFEPFYGDKLATYLNINGKIYIVPQEIYNYLGENYFELNENVDVQGLEAHFSLEGLSHENGGGEYDAQEKGDILRKQDIIKYNLANDVILDYFYDIFMKNVDDTLLIKYVKKEISLDELKKEFRKHKNEIEEKLRYIDDFLEKLENQYEKNKDKDIEDFPKKIYNFNLAYNKPRLEKLKIKEDTGYIETYEFSNALKKNFNGYIVNGKPKIFQSGTNKKEVMKVLKNSNLLDENIILKFSDYFDEHCPSQQ